MLLFILTFLKFKLVIISNIEKFIRRTKDLPSDLLLAEALNFLEKRNFTLVLGCGGMRDTKFLAKNFEKVIAVDKTDLENLPSISDFPNINLVQCKFEEFEFAQYIFDIINARFSLPFVPPANFDIVWKSLTNSLTQNGLFVGQFFGMEDEWNKSNSDKSFHSKIQIEKLMSCQNTKILKLDEIKKIGLVNITEPKFWHYYNIVAQKQ